MKFFRFTLMFLLFSTRLFSGNVQNVSFKHLTTKDGLSSDSVLSIAIDDDGILWFATSNGINRYDGLECIHLSPSENSHSARKKRVFCKKVLCCGDSLFVGSSSALYVLNRKTLAFTEVDGTKGDGMALRGRDLFFSAENKIMKLDKDGVTEIAGTPEADGDILSLCFSRDGETLYAGTRKGMVYAVNEGGMVSFFADCHSKIYEIFIDSASCVYVGTAESGIYFFDLENKKERRICRTHDSENSLSSNFVRCFCEDESGDIWVGTFTGLDKIDRKTFRISHYKPLQNRPDALSHASVWSIARDRQGTLWIGTYYGGVNYFNPSYQIYTRYSSSDREGDGLSSNLVSSIIAETPEKVWIGTEGGGLTLLDPVSGKSEWITVSEMNIKDMCMDREHGHLWIATHIGGVSMVKTSEARVKMFQNLPCNDVISIQKFSTDSIVIGTRDGIWISDSSFQSFHEVLRPDGRSITNAHKIAYFQERLYVLAMGAVFCYDPRTNKIIHNGSYDDDVNGLLVFKDRLLLYTKTNGLFSVDPETLQISNVSLPEKYRRIHSLALSSYSGRLVIGLDDGIAIYDPDSLSIEHYGHAKGFPESTLRDYALHCTEDGTIYIGTTDGLLKVNEKNLSIKGRSYSMFFVSVENPERNRMVFRFSSTNHIPVSTGFPQYKLDNNDWKDCDSGSGILLDGISPGHHTLKLRCSLGEERRSDPMCTQCSTEFDIPRPWYGTLAAILIYILAALSICSYHIRKILKRNEEKQREKAILDDASRKIEEEFCSKARTVIEEHLSESGMNVPFLAKELGVSRTSLYERIKKHTGESPSEMIQRLRLERARYLLVNSPGMNITDIAEAAGFSSQKYLSKCFKDSFGIPPLAFRRYVCGREEDNLK